MAAGQIALTGVRKIRWQEQKPPPGLSPSEVSLSERQGAMGLQVAVAEWHQSGNPSTTSLRALHAARQGKRIFPLVVVAVKGEGAWLLGPIADADPVQLGRSQAERLLQAALAEPNGLAARQRLAGLQQAVASGQRTGVVNQGLFASHYLRTGAPERADWKTAAAKAEGLLGLRHQELIAALGFDVLADGQALLLTEHAASRAVAVLLDADEQFDSGTHRLGVSPVAHGLALAARREVPWLVLLRGSQIRLYPARPGLGVGQKGQADTWFEVDLAVVDAEQAPLLPLVFAASALAPGGSTEQLLAGSAQFAVELGKRLRDRVYERIVPQLSKAVAAQLPALGRPTDAAGLALAYRLTMRVLFRLLFQAYAEDRDLLPYTRNAQFRKHSLKQWALVHRASGPDDFDEASTAIWDGMQTVWRVIDNGNIRWGVPAYNGGLFGSDPVRHPEGREIGRISLPDSVLGPALLALLVDDMESGGVGAVDFRSLSVREFGTIYEGLLESALSVAATDLAVDRKGVYVPAKPGDAVVATEGSVYFHSASGERKATGTFFTPHPVVEHLVRRSVDPVLDEHLARVRALVEDGDLNGAAELFFDFRVADIAMGSGHFLTSAIDHMEAAMRDFLTEHPIPRVADELAALQRAARDALGPDAAAIADTDNAALLRRQIARRCIYGIDINPLAVELSRLAVWITTFVPGLPMSSLDHNLVLGNSLTGVASIDEALRELDPEAARTGQLSIHYSEAITDALALARDLLIDAASAAEATKADVTRGEEFVAQARREAEMARLLFDGVVAGRLGLHDPRAHFEVQTAITAVGDPAIREAVAMVSPAHFPYLFPEVFLREHAGFDVVLGNPPWEKLHVEEHNWWAIRSPGLRSLPAEDADREIARLRRDRPDLVVQLDREREATQEAAAIVSRGPFPGIGAAHLDLMAAFAWRFTHVVRSRGAMGVVLPRTAFAGSALEQWRRTILSRGDVTDLTMLVNNRQWLFPAIHPQYTIALLSYRPTAAGQPITQLQGPYASEPAFVEGTDTNRASSFPASEVLEWTAAAALPLLPDERSLPVFAQMRTSPGLGADGETGWRFRAVQGDLNASTDRRLFTKSTSAPSTPNVVPVMTGRSFELWQPSGGPLYGWTTSGDIERHLQQRRRKQANTSTSAFHGLPPEVVRNPATLPMHHPRIAFRDVARATDSRTMICALVPPEVVVVHKSPYLLRLKGSAKDEAYLLGVLSSIPLDWYTRRFVEITMSFQLLNSFPIPRPNSDSPLRVRVVEVAGRLAAVDDRYAAWAAEVGVPVGSVRTSSEKADLVAELDALVALLYGLDADQVRVVFETFHVGWDHRPRLDAVLTQYAAWAGWA